MKRFLSLVLALVMTMSLVTISAGAKEFTDADSVTYVEAVDVVSAVGIIDGYTDGSFNPQGGLTRGAAAKIICNLILGPTTADNLKADAAPYADVPTDNVFAGYIAYCQKEGIISGYADGTFKPAASLTGFAFMKMLLGALGYDKDIEHYEGANWSINVAKRALNIGLDAGLEGDFVGAKALTREEAMLYAFNTLMATMVEYENASTITVGDIVITNNAKPEDVVSTTAAIAQKFGPSDVDGKHTVQFAEKYFGKLSAIPGSEDGKVGRNFAYDGKDISDFKVTADVLATVYGGTTYAALTAKNNAKYIGYEADTTVSYFLNGTPVTGIYIDTLTANEVYADGIVTEFVDSDDDGKYDVVSVVEKTVAKLTAKPVVKTTGAVTTVTIGACGINGEDVDYVDYPADLAKDDYVLTYYSADSGVYHVEKAEAVEGTLTAYVSGKDSKAVVDGVTYKLSDLKKGGYVVNGTSMNTETSFVPGCTFYLDNAGNICAYEKNPEAASLTNTLFVVNAGASQSYAGGGYTYKADVVFMDGTTDTITVNKTAAYNGVLTAPAAGSIKLAHNETMVGGKLCIDHFYTFTKTDDGKYNLTAVASEGYAASSTKGQVNLTGAIATSETVYVYKATGKTAYTVYEGVSAAPAVSGNVLTLKDANGYVLAAVSHDSTISSTAVTDYIVTFITSPVTAHYKDVNDVDFYEYEAVVDGVVEPSVKTTTNVGVLAQGGVYLVNAKSGDQFDGIVTDAGVIAQLYTQTLASSLGAGQTYGFDVTGLTVATKVVNADGTVASQSAVLADKGVQCFVWDNDETTATEIALADLAGLTDIVEIETVEVSSTNSDIAYYFVTVD